MKSSSTGQTSVSQNNRRHDFMYEAEDVQQPGRRDKGGRMGNDMEAKEEEEDVAAVKASMLHDFKEIMKGGVFVEARSSLTGVRMLSFVFCRSIFTWDVP